MTLTKTSKVFRKSVVYTGIAAVAYYILILLVIPLSKDFILSLFPPKDPPTPIYGMLPPLTFTEKKLKNTSDPSFKLDTTDGKLPADMPKKITVYRVNKPVPSFEKGKDAIESAGTLGYNEADLVSSLKDQIYEWRNLASDGVLKIDTNTREIDLKTPLTGKSEFFPRNNITEERAKQLAIEIFGRLGRFDDPLYNEGFQSIVLGYYEGNRLKKADSRFDAQLARVDFFRKIEDYPILGPDPKRGLLYTVLKNYDEGRDKTMIHYRHPEMEAHIWNIQTQSNASYGLIPVETAWNFVKGNKGILVNVSPENSSLFETYQPVNVEEVFINNIYIAYYDTEEYHEFLQPIYVFEGKYTTQGTQGGTITYYYPAIVPEWIKAAQ